MLQVDHIVPWSFGGLTVLWNTGTLCRDCNLLKLAYWKDRDGYEHNPRGSRANIPLARAIVRKERRHRWNPLRWTRAAWALGGS